MIRTLWSACSPRRVSATAAPAARWSDSSIRAARVRTVKPSPPSAATATLPVVIPALPSSPIVVQPTMADSGPASDRTPASMAGRLCDTEAKTKTAFGSRPPAASAVASAPALPESAALLCPLPNQRCGMVCMIF
jgi:hypothetical protein